MIEDFKLHSHTAPAEPLISIVVPVYNEEDSVGHFAAAIRTVIAESWPTGETAPRFEIVFVDDGSCDATAAIVRAMCRVDRTIRLISLSRNFGKEAALSAGLRAATGDAVIPMDVDLQDPPELIRPMIDKWQAGAQIVNAKRIDRLQDSFLKRTTSRMFYKTINALAEHPIAVDVGDFRLLDRAAVAVLNEMTERCRFNKGLFSWIGFRTETVEYARPARQAGSTKWGVSRLVALALDGITASTTFPLRVWTMVGAIISLAAFAYAAFLIAYTIISGADTPGYASIMVAVLFLGGLNLFSVGLMGEYVGRIAVQVRGRPLYVVAETVGF
ncbi:glycosyltransferase family 2 protein [Porphyrobacter sp. ULC335]|uniref:glycosyltransferase family 2 protein n=1 Tax=Porphyrobacter sp. ULC335 TaxID=2854260 RepID=UPI00221FD392|nr:glycosyltransferase family 2 protein [Porphyrobacter sp. ULC335]UYV15391.1 glycosyltransferase family 2 protein [Porphyrobacter sp. ULC335]